MAAFFVSMQNATVNFVLGLSVGLVFAFLAVSYMSGSSGISIHTPRRIPVEEVSKFNNVPDSVLTHEDLDKIQQIVRPVQFEDAHAHHDDDKEAVDLKNKIRVLCWVMTSPQNLQKKAIHVRNTWAHRCNKLIFISSETNTSFPTVGIDVPEGRDHLTGKTMKAFRFIFENHFDEADWFMKADDDTYVILENLRYFLSSQNKDDPIYFGHHFKTIVKQGYFSGGAGYVLSKEAMRRFGARGNDSKLCRQDGGAEDAEFGKCMQNLGVKVGNSTDKLGRSRFHCFDPETHLRGGYPDWYYKYDAHGAKKGKESISDYAISFHYVPPAKMYGLEFYVYHLRPYGINSGHQDLNQDIS
ncbi:glycoprotein-N-acetylgalactosamine 3-beta-galactosyltransferase 1-like isoform X2 [Ruditapes philippinarum]|uniref:glycoprotein-N-acetylgalactosamine 3-beta-galactosyltransferase 1-like isoform X2 n=2 Tax=Ruditapes philippinarum TaxID=129788 RepID=UPI00295AF68D|nr:glycoprotein-N-acetylgalactosamine 3-beta-galactosyltransferase 1-like isoform X2 [Ruditapes philippinarum]